MDTIPFEWCLAIATSAVRWAGVARSSTKMAARVCAASQMLSATPPASLLCTMSADNTLIATGKPSAAAAAALRDARPLSQNAYKIQVAKTAVKRAILNAAGIATV